MSVFARKLRIIPGKISEIRKKSIGKRKEASFSMNLVEIENEICYNISINTSV